MGNQLNLLCRIITEKDNKNRSN